MYYLTEEANKPLKYIKHCSYTEFFYNDAELQDVQLGFMALRFWFILSVGKKRKKNRNGAMKMGQYPIK